MYNPVPHQVVDLLLLISNKDVETFRNFPDIARAGNQSIPREEVDYLLAEGYLREKKADSFGKYLELSDRGKDLLKNRE